MALILMVGESTSLVVDVCPDAQLHVVCQVWDITTIPMHYMIIIWHRRCKIPKCFSM